MRNRTAFILEESGMAKTQLWILVALLAIPGVSLAEKLAPAKFWEVGDKASYAWTQHFEHSTNVKSEKNEWEVRAVNEAEIWMEEWRGLRKVNRYYDLKQQGFTSWLCWAATGQCRSSPALRDADFPLEPGKRWMNAGRLEGETFVAERAVEHVVEAMESVKVPAGEFMASRISLAGKITGTTNKGTRFSLTEKGVYWIAVANGKPLMVKMQYSNTVPTRITQELESFRFK
jgi:hypothetical protein